MGVDEREITDILVPPFAAGVKFDDSDITYAVASGAVKLSSVDSGFSYHSYGDWFRREDHEGNFESLPFKEEFLHPNLGFLLKEVTGVTDKPARNVTLLGYHLRDGDSIVRIHQLTEEDIAKISLKGDVYEPFIKDSRSGEVILGRNVAGKELIIPGDHAVSLLHLYDDLFLFQLLKSNPRTGYELCGVYDNQDNSVKSVPFTFHADGIGRETAPLKVYIKRD